MENEMELNSFTGCTQRVLRDKVEKSNKPLWPTLSCREGDEDYESDENYEKFEKSIPIFIEKADEHIVCGIVYEPDTEDSQGDSASAEEIQKACYHFMENVRKFKVMHKGQNAKIKILENYIAPQALTINDRKIKKGSWIITTRILDMKLWKAIKDGTLTGFSMAGYAKVS